MEMEDTVKDAILEQKTGDLYLAKLIEITTLSLREGRPLFPNLMDEPVMYTKFHQWVLEGLAEQSKAEEALKEANKQAGL